MDLEIFNETYLPLINLIISGLGLISLIFLIKQYKKDNHWKKLESSYNFIDIGDELNLQERLYQVYEKLQVYSFPESCKPLSAEEVNLIRSNSEATLLTNMFLNHLQNLCIAYTFELVNEDVFNNIHAGRISWWHTILKPYIDQRKEDYLNPTIWNDFEKIAEKCKPKKVNLENKKPNN